MVAVCPARRRGKAERMPRWAVCAPWLAARPLRPTRRTHLGMHVLSPPSRPLEGIRVLDLTMALAGPYGALMLGGMGAEVIHVEAPQSRDTVRQCPPFVGPRGLHHGAPQPDETSLLVLDRARNKKSITLDLKTEAGRALFMQLVQVSDVVLENMSSGVAQRLGVDYATLEQVNPRLVYGSISGFGDNPAYAGLKGTDILIQALSGLMHVTGFADGPPTRVGLPIADLVAPLYAVNGILAALIQRGRTGQGQHVQVAMLDCLVSLLAVEHLDVAATAPLALRTGNSLDRLVPFGVYACSDGHIAIAAYQADTFAALARAMQHPELMHNRAYLVMGFRTQHAAQINHWIGAWTAGQTTAQVLDCVSTQHGIPAAIVRSPLQAQQDPYLLSTGAITQITADDGSTIGVAAGNPIAFSKAHAQFDQAAHALGADNVQIYTELLGMTAQQLDTLRAQGVI